MVDEPCVEGDWLGHQAFRMVVHTCPVVVAKFALGLDGQLVGVVEAVHEDHTGLRLRRAALYQLDGFEDGGKQYVQVQMLVPAKRPE